jgi:hypothetical protein
VRRQSRALEGGRWAFWILDFGFIVENSIFVIKIGAADGMGLRVLRKIVRKATIGSSLAGEFWIS